MAKKKMPVIEFEACLQQSTPAAKPLKFGPDGESVITLEADASEKINVVKLLGISAGTMLRVKVEVV